MQQKKTAVKVYCTQRTLTVFAVGESDGSSDVTGGLQQSTSTGVGDTVSAADRGLVCTVPWTVVHHITAQTVRHTELINDARLTSSARHARTRRCVNQSVN